MRVSELMTTDVLTATPEMRLKDAALSMSDNSVSGLPVVDSDYRVIGILTEADFVARAGSQSRAGLLDWILGHDVTPPEAETVGEAMQRSVHTIGADALHGEAAWLMQKKKVKRLPVVDADGALVGVVSRSDILKVFTRTDAAIRSEILERVVRRVVMPDSDDLEVAVENGMVCLSGTVATRTEALLLRELSAVVDGVIGLDSKLRFLVDDTLRSNAFSNWRAGAPR